MAGTLLHIGGKTRTTGWTVVDISPGAHVDLVADCTNLSTVPSNSCAIVYASHVLEHIWPGKMADTLIGFHRILAPNGKLMVAVPDFEAICRLFLNAHTNEDQVFLLSMAYGGHSDIYDVHQFGYTRDILGGALTKAGFRDVRQVSAFGLFSDSSTMRFKDTAVSLNMVGVKRAA